MKKIGLFFSVFILFGLTGCKDKETGLQKNVLNSAINDCTASLRDSLKSPSSLKVGEVSAATYIPKMEDISRVAAETLIDQETGKISEVMERLKVRYRELGLSIQYEAQNAFGVYLKDKFSCSYIYQLTNDKTSPEDEIWLSKLSNSNGSVGTSKTVYLKDSSNYLLDSRYKSIIADAPTEQLKSDKNLLEEVQSYWNTQKGLKEFPNQNIDNLN